MSDSVKVTFSYTAVKADELDLNFGEVITNVDTSVEGGWWEGTHPSGKRGWFPDNFVDKIVEKKKPPPPAPAKTAAKQCRCTFAYQAQREDELTINPGDIITITKQEEEGWWEGIFNGKTGVFPNNFVEEIPAGAAAPAAAAAPPPAADNSGGDDEAKPKKVEKVGFGNIFAGGGVPQLRKTGTFSGKKPEFLNKQNRGSPVPPRAAHSKPGVDPKSLDLVKVEFNYDAEHPDELSLKKGQFVLVTKREDEGWWEGDLVGTKKSGLFPDNFVVPASDSEKAEQAAVISPGSAAAKAPLPAKLPPAAPPNPDSPPTTSTTKLRGTPTMLPATVQKEDGTSFLLDFPWELNNTDYLHRILAHVTYALRPVYRRAVTTHKLPKVEVSGKTWEPEDADTYAIMKHMRANTAYYLKELNVPPAFLKTTTTQLNELRNDFAHQQLGGVSKDVVEEHFTAAIKLALAVHSNVTWGNLERLEAQFKAHWKSKQARKKTVT